MDVYQARSVLKQVENRILSKPNIIGTGIGYKNNDSAQGIALIANAVKKLPCGTGRDAVGVFNRVSKSYDGIPTDVYEVGDIKAFTTPAERQAKWRPTAPGGVSIGHHKTTAGTLGCLVRKNGSPYILSNNHVLANSNDAKIGDSILQPGPYDGGGNDDLIGELSKRFYFTV